jgi:hypothetical protein
MKFSSSQRNRIINNLGKAIREYIQLKQDESENETIQSGNQRESGHSNIIPVPMRELWEGCRDCGKHGGGIGKELRDQ